MNEKYLRQYIRLSLGAYSKPINEIFGYKKKEHQYGAKDYLRKFMNIFSSNPAKEAAMYFIEDIEDEFDFEVSSALEDKIEKVAEKYLDEVSRTSEDDEDIMRNLIYSLRHDSSLMSLIKKESKFEKRSDDDYDNGSSRKIDSLSDEIAIKFIEDLELYHDIEIPKQIEQKAVELCKKNFPKMLDSSGGNKNLAEKKMKELLKKELAKNIKDLT